MGKSNNPAKRAEQEKDIQAKKARRAKKGSGFLKFVIVAVLTIAIIGPFFAGLTNLTTTPTTVPTAPATAPAAPATIPATVAPATAPAAIPATATAPAGQ